MRCAEVDAAEYKHVVLGLLFLKYISDSFESRRDDLKIELGYADEEIDATAADPRIAEILSIPRRDPLLRIRQVIYSTKGQAIMYVQGFYRSDRHNLVIRRFR